MSVRRTTAFLTAAAAAVLLTLSGCGAGASDSPHSDSKAAAPEAGNAAAAGGAGPAAADGGNAPAKVPDNLDAENRSIIYAGTMTVRVKNVDEAAARAIAFATGAGGFIGGDNRTRDDLSSTGTLTLRVPAAKFTATLEQLKGLGDEENRQVNAQDVTDQVVDVASRIQTAQASVDRIRALLAKAQTIGEVTSIESELSRRESDLESLQARKRKLDGLTALSTITLVLLGPQAVVEKKKKESTGIGVGLRNGWSAFVASLQVVLTVLGWLIPWVLLLGVPAYLVVWAMRRFLPKRPAPAPRPTPLIPAAMPAGMPAGMPPFPANRPAPGQQPPRPAAPPQIETPKDEAPKDEAPKDETPKDETPKGPAADH